MDDASKKHHPYLLPHPCANRLCVICHSFEQIKDFLIARDNFLRSLSVPQRVRRYL